MKNQLQVGFGKTNITPRVGVELCGFGPFLNRRSIAVRDNLWARAMAVSRNGRTLAIVSCDLVGITATATAQIRALVVHATGLDDESVMVHCTHTHSGPNTGGLIGWGALDEPYNEILPHRVADAVCRAVAALRPARLSFAETPCQGIGYNREHDKTHELSEVLREDWRPDKPELTDTVCRVLRAEDADGRLLGFAGYFGCHPVVCCSECRYIHGDYCGVATNMLERENPGAIGLFLQGAEGDVNSCVVARPEQESLLALDVIAGRYARAVRRGLQSARPMDVPDVNAALKSVRFSRKLLSLDDVRARLAEQEQIIRAPGAGDAQQETRMAVVKILSLRRLKTMIETGADLVPVTQVQGMRLGSLLLLGAPFDVFQAIKNDVVAHTAPRPTLTLSQTNDRQGYAVARDVAARGGYAAEQVPMMLGAFAFAAIHDELVKELTALADDLL